MLLSATRSIELVWEDKGLGLEEVLIFCHLFEPGLSASSIYLTWVGLDLTWVDPVPIWIGLLLGQEGIICILLANTLGHLPCQIRSS